MGQVCIAVDVGRSRTSLGGCCSPDQKGTMRKRGSRALAMGVEASLAMICGGGAEGIDIDRETARIERRESWKVSKSEGCRGARKIVRM